MKFAGLITVALATAVFAAVCAKLLKKCPPLTGSDTIDVAAFVWPAFQPEPRWAQLGIFGDGKGEWQNIYEAVPRFAGHDQPKIPLWGYENEADPKVVSKKIRTALKYGVNVFIYDWYWFDGKPFLEDGLDKGFLGSPENPKMKFYIMWANHNVDATWNNKIADKNSKQFWRGAVDSAEFEKISERIVSKYFTRPNYYKIDGKPVFSIYELENFIDGVGGLDNAAKAVESLDKKCKAAGLGGVHIQTMYWKVPENLAPAALGGQKATSAQVLKMLRVESMTTYNWIHYRGANNSDYADWGATGVAKWDEISKKFPDVKYFAHVSIGWDNNARYPASKAVSIVKNSNPQKFEIFLQAAREWTNRHSAPKLVTINSWNEWPEGSYIEPDKTNGFGYLEAVRRVFGSKGD